MAGTFSRLPFRGCDRCAAWPGRPLPADRIHLPRLRDRPSGFAASPARRPYFARRARIPRRRGGRHAGLYRPIGHSALKRPRAPARDREPPPAAGSASENAIVAKFNRAWQSADLDGIMALLTDDVFISMPPVPFGYEGRDVAARFCAASSTSARGSASYRRGPTVSLPSGPACVPRMARVLVSASMSLL